VKVLVAPDKFKGSLTAAQVTDRIAVGLNQITAGSPLELAFTRIHQITDLTDTDTRHDPDLTARILTQVGEAIAAQLHPAATPSPARGGAS
jgi:hypothetical protein